MTSDIKNKKLQEFVRMRLRYCRYRNCFECEKKVVEKAAKLTRLEEVVEEQEVRFEST